jgi:hypothetical protein
MTHVALLRGVIAAMLVSAETACSRNPATLANTARCAALAALLIVSIACAELSRPTAPTEPQPGSPPLDRPMPSEPQPRNPQTHPIVTGVVFASTGHGRLPISNARVVIVDLIDGPYNFGWSEVLSDTEGRFVASVFPGRPVKITAYASRDYAMWNQSGLNQVCAVHPRIDGDTTADVELVPDGRVPTAYRSPTLTGTVFETAHGRRPLAGMSVLYSSYSHDGADVYARTDADGRYNFCNLPLGPGYVLAGCFGNTALLGSHFASIDVEIRKDTVLDVDVTSSVGSCR